MLLELGEMELIREKVKDRVPRHPLYEEIIKHELDLSKLSFSKWKGYINNYRETGFLLQIKARYILCLKIVIGTDV